MAENARSLVPLSEVVHAVGIETMIWRERPPRVVKALSTVEGN